MKNYIGTKTIKATPAYKGEDGIIYPKENSLPNGMEEDSLKDGYMVIYKDGYTSWSPKDVFETSYHAADTLEDRLIIEIKELEEKIAKLDKFINSDNLLNMCQHSILTIQQQAMQTYLTCLSERLTTL